MNYSEFFLPQLNASILYPLAVSFGAETLVSIERIEEFLIKTEKNDTESGVKRKDSLTIVDEKRE